MSKLHPLITDLAFILAITSIFSILFKWLKQPVVLAYISAGIALSLFSHNKQEMYEHIKAWADIGVIFLLFGLGLEFSFKKLLTKIGPSAYIATITIITSMIGLGYLVGTCLGWSHITSLFLGAMLCMSSTMVIVKVFDDLNLSKKKFTEIVFGILVIEDLMAVVLMVLLSTIAISRKFEGQKLLYSLIKLSAFLLFWFALGIYFIPLTLQKAKRFLNDEVLLILAITFCLGMVFFATQAGYSSALGAFVMGSILAETIEGEHIEHLLLPIKNLFGMLFFVSIGMLINVNTLGIYNIISIGIVSLIIIIGQTLFATIGVLLSGQNLKIAVLTGFSLAQIGEFSYVIGSLGLSLGVIEQSLYQVVVSSSIVTILVLPCMMKLAPIVYDFLEKKLPQKWINCFTKEIFESNLIKDENLWRKLLKNMATTTGIYFFIACIIIFFSLKYGRSVIQSYLPGSQGDLLCSSLIILLIAPFLWMIIFRNRNSPEFTQLWNENEENKVRLVFAIVFRIIICIGLIMYILEHLLNLHSISAFVIALVILAIFLTSKKLGKHSHTIERHFIDNLNVKERYKKSKTVISKNFTNHLMKQDLHLSDFNVEYNYSIVGKTLKELNFRQHFGINIIIILRGNQKINIPHGEERIYPKDRLIVFGTDKQMELFQTKLEEESGQTYLQDEEGRNPSADIVLQQFEILSNSQLIGQTISSSQMQKKYHCLLVGIERNNFSTLKPNTTVPFKKGDILWIAGEHDNIKKLKNL